MNPLHTYTEPDKYLVTSKVTDAQGSFLTNQPEITVKKARGKK
jgi:PKD repeat protein